jgi:uncharacterized protein
MMRPRSDSRPDRAPQQPGWLRALLREDAFAHEVASLRVLETHISWVILTGSYAYKIKKPVRFDFLDFSTLELRRLACEEELRLNRRFAPQLYVDVVAIRGDAQRPRIDGQGPVLDYAVRMREFAQDAQLDRLLDSGRLRASDMQALGRRLARFHADAAVAGEDTRWGRPEQILDAAVANLEALRRGLPAAHEHARLARLGSWSAAEYERLRDLFAARRGEGRVRELHGDLHLANLVLHDGEVLPFDCIEFSAALRWLDVFDDLAFLLMDLELRGRRDLAYRTLDTYLEASGDYEGLRVLRWYKVYRALVRAKVAQLRAAQTTGDQARRQLAERSRYLRWASICAAAQRPALLLMYGLSGSGKTWVSDLALAALPAVRVRSDVERKRLHGLDANAASGSALKSGIYAAAATQQTYAHLAGVARAIVAGGEIAIVDATFLRRADRLRFRDLAAGLRVPFAMLCCEAPDAVLDQRVRQRQLDRGDASEADVEVLRLQRSAVEVPADDERHSCLTIDTTAPAEQIETLLRAGLRALLGRNPAAVPAARAD